MKRSAAILFLFIGMTLFSAENLKEYPFYRTLTLKETSKTATAAAIPFDKFLYKNTNEDYTNLLILDQNGKRVPYAVRNSAKMVQETLQIPYSGTITGFFWNSKANVVTVDFMLKEPQEINGLIFHTRIKQFNKKVSLQFFDLSGKMIREEKNLSLYQYGSVFGNSAVNFPTIKTKKVRAVIYQYMEEKEYITRKESAGPSGVTVERIVKQEDFQLSSISAYRNEIRKKSGGTAIKTLIELPEHSRQNQGNMTEIRISAYRVPCTDLVITSDDSMYRRRITVFTVEDGKEYFLTEDQISPDQKEIELPDNRADDYIIRIHNENNDPLKNIRLQWRITEKCLILIPPAGNLKLYYGGNAPKQKYDIEHFADKFENPPRIYLIGAETKSPEYAPAVPKNMIYQVFMWVFFGVDALVLLVIIIRLLRKSPEDEE